MTKEEAIEWLKKSNPNNIIGISSVEHRDIFYKRQEAFDMAIKALKQEDVLDKIRAEIENDWQLKKYPNSPFSCGLRRAIEIIDKYKAESEDGKNENN